MSLIDAINNVRSGIVQIIFMATFSPEQMKKIGRPFISQTLGSGFFINAEAYIITARHVIQEGRNKLEQFDARAPQTCPGNRPRGYFPAWWSKASSK